MNEQHKFDPTEPTKPLTILMRETNEEQTRKTAEEHWKFLEKWLHMIFVDGFIHGYKHALEDRELEEVFKEK